MIIRILQKYYVLFASIVLAGLFIFLPILLQNVNAQISCGWHCSGPGTWSCKDPEGATYTWTGYCEEGGTGTCTETCVGNPNGPNTCMGVSVVINCPGGSATKSSSGCCLSSPPAVTATPTPTPATCLPVAAPANLDITCNAADRMTVTWNAVPNATYYSLRVNNQADGWDGSCSSAQGDFCIDVTGTSHTFTVDPNDRYHWWIHARNSCDHFGSATYGDVNKCVPNARDVSGPSTLDVGESGTYSATVESLNGELAGELFWGNFNSIADNGFGGTGNNVTSGTVTGNWAPAAAGSYQVCARAWNDAIAECRPSSLVAGPPQYACSGPNVCKTVTVAAGEILGTVIGGSGNSTVVVRDSGNQIVRTMTVNSDGGTYTTGDILTPGATYTVEITPPATKYQPYFRHYLDNNKPPSSDTGICDYDTPSGTVCFKKGQSVTVTIPTTGSMNRYVDWRMVAGIGSGGQDDLELEIKPGAGASAESPAGITGLSSFEGGLDYNNPLATTLRYTLPSGASINEIGTMGIAFMDDDATFDFDCPVDKNANVPLDELIGPVKAGNGFIMTYFPKEDITKAERSAWGAGDSELQEPEHFYVYYKDASDGQWKWSDPIVNGDPMGSQTEGIRADPLLYSASGSIHIIEGEWAFFSKNNRLERWRAIGFVSTTLQGGSSRATVAGLCP